MNGREYLEYVRSLNVRLRIKKDRIEQLRKDICTLQAIDYSKDRISGTSSSDISDKIIRLDELISKTYTEWDTLIDEREKAETLINSLINVYERRILQLRYVYCKSWSDVEDGINMSHVQTFRLHKQAVKHFNLIYRKERRV
nr:MAG TPA: Protein of unknown function (DUF1492) [Caudoviricetes sp.]